MDNFQLILLMILIAVVIVVVLVHGSRSIRQQQMNKSMNQPSPNEFERDSSGFDNDGVGEVRIRKSNSDAHISTNKQASPMQVNRAEATSGMTARRDPNGVAPYRQAVVKPTHAAVPAYNPAMSTHAPTHTPAASVMSAKDDDEDIGQVNLGADSQHSLFEDPVTSRKPESKAKVASEQATVSQQPTPTAGEIKSDDQEPADKVKDEGPKDVLVLHVVAEEGNILDGAELLQSLLTLNFKFGEMNIFHRHEDNAGTGDVLFSMANMVKPGTFNPDEMEQFTTHGVVFFMTLPCHSDPLMTFSLMLNAACQLADDLKCQLLDGKREPWSRDVKQSYLQRLKD